MMQEQERQETGTAETSAEEKKTAEAPTNGWLEQVYSHFDGVPLKALDIFIGICVFALIAVVTVGILKARGIL